MLLPAPEMLLPRSAAQQQAESPRSCADEVHFMQSREAGVYAREARGAREQHEAKRAVRASRAASASACSRESYAGEARQIEARDLRSREQSCLRVAARLMRAGAEIYVAQNIYKHHVGHVLRREQRGTVYATYRCHAWRVAYRNKRRVMLIKSSIAFRTVTHAPSVASAQQAITSMSRSAVQRKCHRRSDDTMQRCGERGGVARARSR